MSTPPKPLVVKTTIWLLGTLAFISLVACRNFAEELPAQNIANGLRAVAANLAFVGAISGTRLGYKAVVGLLGLGSIGACFGIYSGIQIMFQTPMLGLFALLLSLGFIAWFYMYAFGDATRAYYSQLS
jgi:uncharacterized membrane protein